MTTRITQTVRVTDNLPKLKAALKSLTKKEIAVGWPEGKEKKRTGSDEITNANLAFLMEKGSPAKNRPPRAMLEPGIKEGEDKIRVRLRHAGEDALDGNTQAMEKNFVAAGVEAVSAVRNKIVVGPFAPLKASTIAARRRRGFFGTLPLQVTGQLRNSVNFSVRDRKL